MTMGANAPKHEAGESELPCPRSGLPENRAVRGEEETSSSQADAMPGLLGASDATDAWLLQGFDTSPHVDSLVKSELRPKIVECLKTQGEARARLIRRMDEFMRRAKVLLWSTYLLSMGVALGIPLFATGLSVLLKLAAMGLSLGLMCAIIAAYNYLPRLSRHSSQSPSAIRAILVGTTALKLAV